MIQKLEFGHTILYNCITNLARITFQLELFNE